MKTKFATGQRLFRAIFARLLCLLHMALSIFVLYSIKEGNYMFLIPIVGTVFFVVELGVTCGCYNGREQLKWFSPMFFIYVITIIGCYWFLELENVQKSIKSGTRHSFFITQEDLSGDITANIKVIWSKVFYKI
jgi:heme/copper-type cytochrome/quinol oxidase subunit 4